MRAAEVQDDHEELSLLARRSGPLPRSSPLRRELPRPPTAARYKGISAASRGAQGTFKCSEDQPVTFHSQVKSSGYGRERPVMRLGTGLRGRKAATRRLERRRKEWRALRARTHEYPVDCGPLVALQEQHVFEEDAQSKKVALPPVLAARFDGEATLLATAGQDGGVRLYPLPIGSKGGKGMTLRGHDNRVNDVRFSHCGKLLLSSGDDKKALVWRLGRAEPIIEINGAAKMDQTQLTSKLRGHHVATSRTLSSPNLRSHVKTTRIQRSSQSMRGSVTFSSFFHLDRLLAVAAGPDLSLHAYRNDVDNGRNDLERLSCPGEHQQVLKYTFDCRSITAADALNSAPSHLILLAGSNRTIFVFDAAHNKLVRAVEDAHARPVNNLVLPGISRYASVDSDQYNVFATSATDGIVALWDLRAPRVCANFDVHANRRERVGLSFSPCMRYLAVGSEDRQALMWDLRCADGPADDERGRKFESRVCHSVLGATDVVSSIAFNPVYPQVAVGSYDGLCRFYTC